MKTVRVPTEYLIAAHRPVQGEAEFDIYINHREFCFNKDAFGCLGWLLETVAALKHFILNQHIVRYCSSILSVTCSMTLISPEHKLPCIHPTAALGFLE